MGGPIPGGMAGCIMPPPEGGSCTAPASRSHSRAAERHRAVAHRAAARRAAVHRVAVQCVAARRRVASHSVSRRAASSCGSPWAAAQTCLGSAGLGFELCVSYGAGHVDASAEDGAAVEEGAGRKVVLGWQVVLVGRGRRHVPHVRLDMLQRLGELDPLLHQR
eukprot:scaffold97351_cov51-Phaeocystis_antarctica.AAC.2